jgi:uncharacterized protein YjbI with pentapeptide repeats
MFGHTTCKQASCANLAVHLNDFCFAHIKDKDAYLKELGAFIKANESFRGLNLCGIPFNGIDFSGKTMRFCNLARGEFAGCNFTNSTWYMVFAEFSTFRECDFSHSHMKWTVLSGSVLKDCGFLESDIVRSAFVGAETNNAKFNNSDLYSTRFINAKLHNTEIMDCNILLTHFEHSRLDQVDFKYSNLAEAYFDKGVATSVRSPNMNAYAERFISSVRREALDNFIILNEKQLRNILLQYIHYYNSMRPHQGIRQKIPDGYTSQTMGTVVSVPVLSGLHHHYTRVA